MQNLPAKLKNRKGFTLVETLLGVSIFIIILMSITLLARNIWNYNSFVSAGLGNIDIGRKVLKVITSEIRSASSASNGSYAINQATATSFIFFSDINDNGLKERVRYFLNGSLLQKGVTIPTGSPLGYDLATEKVSTVMSYVTNSNIFDYYDTNYDGTTAALSFPINVASVRLIKINLVVDQDPNKPPAPVTFSTQVSLRNLKDNL